MKTISEFFYAKATWLIFLIVTVVYVSFPAYILPHAQQSIEQLAGKAVGIIDLGMNFNAETVQKMVADYGQEGRALYSRTEMTTDVLYPITYGLFYTLLITLLYKGRNWGAGFRLLNIMPLLVVLLDFTENTFIVTLLNSYPDSPAFAVYGCLTFRALKWVGVIGMSLYAVVLLVVRLVSWLRKK